jgi:hypothetical protein
MTHTKDFEEFVKAELGDIAVSDNGRYISPKIQNYWKIWEHCKTTPPAKPEQHGLADEVIGCFGAAECEGLTEALANTADERLKDLVERRLMHALYAAQEAKEKSE